MTRTTLVIPCFNEAARLDGIALTAMLDDGRVDLLLVDDGSTDSTRTVLDTLAASRPGRIRVLALSRNAGKAEAVRCGLVAALEQRGPDLVGFLDADLATPPDEMRRLIDVMCTRDAHVLLGARVALLGRMIDRSPVRHYLGRVFATLASLTLRLPAYDTQCGAKLFRATPLLADVLRDPFISRWAFDVELIGRMLIGTARSRPIPRAAIWEEPLRTWRDVKGSKLAPRHMAGALADLLRIERDLAARRIAVEKRNRGGSLRGPARYCEP